MLTIAVSSRSLFQIEDGNKIFETEGQDAFNEYMRSKEDTPLRKGVAFPLVRKLLGLNSLSPNSEPLVEVVMLSRNSPDAGMRVMNSIQHYGLNIERAVFSQGLDRFKYAKALGAHLFLSTAPADVKRAIDHGLAAATMLPVEQADDTTDSTVRIAFDGDSVLFSSEADECYRENGLDAFRKSELANANIPLGAGPFKIFLEEIHRLQQVLPKENPQLRMALVTARGMPAHARVLHTLRSWDIRIDEGIFAAGCPKGPLLEAFSADIFFDDTHRNIDSARSCNVVSGHVPFGSGHGIVNNSPELQSA
jgi:5'-nucleotidase